MISRLLARAWAFPNTLLGLYLVPFALWTGGRWSLVAGALEVHGGILERWLGWWPRGGGAAAITLGHVVLAMSDRDLDATRAHERVHVRQFERWGPLFLPAYLLASVWAWARGRDPYAENCFEREAIAGEAGKGPPG